MSTSPSARDTYSTLLGHLVSSIAQPLNDLTVEETHCVCVLLGVLEAGLHVAAVKAQDLEIQDSKGMYMYSFGVVDCKRSSPV